MRFFGPGWASFIATPFYDATDDGGGGGGGAEKDAKYWEAEAKKAFTARDTAKAEAKKLADGQMSAEDRALFDKLKADQATAEEERAKKAGEFETLKTTLTKKHETELADRENKLSTLSDRFRRTVVRAELGAATDLFGGHEDALTVLDVDMADAVLGKFIHVEEDEKSALGYRIVVKIGDEPIVDGKGNPAPLAKALAEVIETLPNRDRILRGSGKAGSGATGDGPRGKTKTVDVSRGLSREQRNDPKVIAQLKAQRSGGGLQLGRGFGRVPAQAGD